MTGIRASAVVFGYHNVGARCLRVLLAHGIDVRLVVTHEDSPTENIWFESIAEVAHECGIPTVTPGNPNDGQLEATLRRIAPDFLFSFYYRHMLKPSVLATASRGAYNMHGSLLPKYRGRVPVNWAIIHGERETGASLHEMLEKPDAGRLAGQQRVPILPNDTAHDVFAKVVVAAELVMDRALPGLVAGTANLTPQNLSQGSYFGGRKPEDGRIDWRANAWAIHNLVRAVAPPYPGAFFTLGHRTLRVLRTHWPGRAAIPGPPTMQPAGDGLVARCIDGIELPILSAEIDGEPLTVDRFRQWFGEALRLPIDPSNSDSAVHSK